MNISYKCPVCGVVELPSSHCPFCGVKRVDAPVVEQVCFWTHRPEQYGQSGYWETSCGHIFILIDGTPIDNEMKFCPYCGKRLEEKTL